MTIAISDLPVNTNSLNSPIPTTSGGTSALSNNTGGIFSTIAQFAPQLSSLLGGNKNTQKAVGTASGAVSGAIAGTAINPGIGTAVGAIIGAISSFFGKGSNPKGIGLNPKNVAEDKSANVISFKDVYETAVFENRVAAQSPTDDLTGYYNLLTAEEKSAIENQVIAQLQENPYWGLTGNPEAAANYTSPITGKTTVTNIWSGVAKGIDDYLTAKNAALNSGQGVPVIKTIAEPIQQPFIDAPQPNNTAGIIQLNNQSLITGISIIAGIIILIMLMKRGK